MITNGLYLLKTTSDNGRTISGILLLEDGKIRGGDSKYTAVGRYWMDGDRLCSTLSAKPQPSNNPNPKLRHLEVGGKIEEDGTITLHGQFETEGREAFFGTLNLVRKIEQGE